MGTKGVKKTLPDGQGEGLDEFADLTLRDTLKAAHEVAGFCETFHQAAVYH